MSGPYRVPHIHVEVAMLMTNKTPVGTYRGPGRFEADFCRERLFDMVAADLGIDRVEFRRRNLVPEVGDALSAGHGRSARRRDRMRQRRLSYDARSLPRGIRLGGEGEARRQADRRPLPRHRRRLLHRRRRVRPEGECAPAARSRRLGLGLRRLVVGRPGRRDGVRADCRGRARNADGSHQRRVPRLDRLSRRRIWLVQLALDRHGRLRRRRRGQSPARNDPRGRGTAPRLRPRRGRDRSWHGSRAGPRDDAARRVCRACRRRQLFQQQAHLQLRRRCRPRRRRSQDRTCRSCSTMSRSRMSAASSIR